MEMPFRPLNKISKLYLKITDKAKYIKYKRQVIYYKIDLNRTIKLNAVLAQKTITNPDKIKALAKVKGKINFIHAGNAGDIIYALPTLKAIYKLTGVPINLYLLLDQPHGLDPMYTHPLGNVTLNLQMANMLTPLIDQLEYINSCLPYQSEEIDIKLDLFRELPLLLDKGNIIRWYNYTTGILPEVATPWLKATPSQNFSDKIVIARSQRYRNPHIDYNFLNKYKNLCFIGVKSEYEEIVQCIPKIEFVEVSNFLQMAEIIAGAAFFIGNQSFPFSIAEALKVPRILETSFEAPNVIPDGDNGFDFLLQEHFEWHVENLNQRHRS
ncbi:hypothetical protein LPB86_02595 [Pedobacter sp. MC2016-14]|uniref:hypothetical protein n=1 Tax=Pedobacter sp. MC2016-14 TaxID=2897327 RepID=UPI001E3C41B1|nr:hypothetical protein [Pedobacter sp. MC2016-14]MCD0487101.1 hypothetical protein [Pedobacter sp. MC2016-14]